MTFFKAFKTIHAVSLEKKFELDNIIVKAKIN
jgi:hypothetical protein